MLIQFSAKPSALTFQWGGWGIEGWGGWPEFIPRVDLNFQLKSWP